MFCEDASAAWRGGCPWDGRTSPALRARVNSGCKDSRYLWRTCRPRVACGACLSTSVSWVFSPFLRVPGQGLLRTEQQQPTRPGTSSLEWLLSHSYVCRKFTTIPSLKTDTVTSPPQNQPRWKLTPQDEHKNILKISFKAAAQVLENTSMSD